MRYKYIFFDIDDTLIDFHQSYDRGAAAVLRLGKCEVNEDNLAKYFECGDKMWYELELNQIWREEIRKSYHTLYVEYLYKSVERAQYELALEGDTDKLYDCFIREFGAGTVNNPHIEEVLTELGGQHHLYVATNGLMRLQPLKLHELGRYFEKVYISEAVGFIKPEKEYFEKILNDVGATPSECLMIGDSLPNDIAGALNAGIAACYYNPEGREWDTKITPTYVIKDFRELLEIV